MIQIKLDKKTKIQIKGLHWLWFWKRLNDKKLHLASGPLSAFQFLNKYLGWTKKDFYNIVLGEYTDLSEYIKPANRYNSVVLEKMPPTFEFYKWNVGNKSYGPQKINRELKDIVSDCFGYNDFRCGSYKFGKGIVPDCVKKWCAYSFVEMIKIEVCPYCNKEYIPIIKTNNKYRAEIDHFFPAAEYPFLSCSLFNFIPSCLVCNHHKNDVYNKYDKQGNIKLTIYPYTEGFEEFDDNGEIKKNAVFKAIPGSGNLYESKAIKLEYNNPSLEDKMKKTNDAFLIEELYNTCQTELEDLLTRHRNYAYPKIQNIIDMLSKDVKNKLDSLKISQEQKDDLLKEISSSFNKSMRNQILGIPLNSAGKEVNKDYPFRKFKNDIIKQLDDWVKLKKAETT